MYKKQTVPLDSSALPGYIDRELESLAGEVNGFPTSRYVSSWTTTSTAPALGNGSLYAWYLLNNDLCELWLKLVAGSTTTFGTTGWRFELPVLASPIPAVGIAMGFDTSAALRYSGSCRVVDGERLLRVSFNAATDIANNVPFIWATGDELWAHIRFIRRANS